MTQEKLWDRARLFKRESSTDAITTMEDFARAELQKAAEIADRYKEPLIAEEIRKLME